MIFMSASSNPAGTILTVVGATEGDRTLRESEHENYVVSGDAHKIAEELNKRSGTRLLKAIAMDWGIFPQRFTWRDLPPDAFRVQVVTPDGQRAAEGLTVEERDYIFASAFERHEIFEVIVERYRAERMQDKVVRADKIRADLEAIGTPQQLDSARDEDSKVPYSAKGEMMEFLFANSNPANTVLTVRGYRTSRASGRRVRTECREDYVVAGDAYEIAKSLTLPSLSLRALIFGVRFDALKLPQPFRMISVTNRDEELAAWEITRAERDFFFDSGIHQNEIFQQLVPWKSAERARRAEERATEIRANLEQLKLYIGTDAPPHDNNAQ